MILTPPLLSVLRATPLKSIRKAATLFPSLSLSTPLIRLVGHLQVNIFRKLSETSKISQICKDLEKPYMF